MAGLFFWWRGGEGLGKRTRPGGPFPGEGARKRGLAVEAGWPAGCTQYLLASAVG